MKCISVNEKEKLMKEYECFGMGFVSEEKCGDCEIKDECQQRCEIESEEWAYQSEWDRLHDPPEEEVVS